MNDSPIKQHHWGPNPEVLAHVERLAQQQKEKGRDKRCVEYGPGNRPFAPANYHIVRKEPGVKAQGIIAMVADFESRASMQALEEDMAPSSYTYCRHVVEDLIDPRMLLDELHRHDAGYIETPSPMAELTRGVDGGSPKWRGYHHHRWIVWVEGEVLNLIPKYPIVERLELPDYHAELNAGPLHWNTYAMWTKDFSYKVWRHDEDFTVTGNYTDVLQRAVTATLARNDELAAAIRYQASKSAPSDGNIPVWGHEPKDHNWVIERYDNKRWPGARAQRWYAHKPADPAQPGPLLVGGSWLDLQDWTRFRASHNVGALIHLDDHPYPPFFDGEPGMPFLELSLPDDCRPRAPEFWRAIVSFAMRHYRRNRLVPGRDALMVCCGMGRARSTAAAYAILRGALGYSEQLARERIQIGIAPTGPHPSLESIAPYLASAEEALKGMVKS